MANFCFGNNVLFSLLFYAKNPAESAGVFIFSLRQLEKKLGPFICLKSAIHCLLYCLHKCMLHFGYISVSMVLI